MNTDSFLKIFDLCHLKEILVTYMKKTFGKVILSFWLKLNHFKFFSFCKIGTSFSKIKTKHIVKFCRKLLDISCMKAIFFFQNSWKPENGVWKIVMPFYFFISIYSWEFPHIFWQCMLCIIDTRKYLKNCCWTTDWFSPGPWFHSWWSSLASHLRELWLIDWWVWLYSLTWLVGPVAHISVHWLKDHWGELSSLSGKNIKD